MDFEKFNQSGYFCDDPRNKRKTYNFAANKNLSYL